jgi:hypothetical protein
MTPILLGIDWLCENEMAIELKDGCLRQIKDGKLKSYPIRPQLTEGMSESIEPGSESCKNQEIAKCSQIPTSGTEKLFQLEINDDAEPAPQRSNSKRNEQGEEDPVVKVRIALATEKYNPSVIRRSDVDKDESQGQRPKRTGYDINKVSTGACIPGNTTQHSDLPDPRCASCETITQLANSVGNLSAEQKNELRELLLGYRGHFTSKPGKFHMLEYEFELNNTTPTVAHTRPVPLTLRPAVRSQLRQMVEDGIIETAKSPYINPLTIVPRPGSTAPLTTH